MAPYPPKHKTDSEIFGVPQKNGNDGKEDAKNDVRAAMRMDDEFDKILPRWIEKWKLYTPHKIEIGLGCGIHTGEALVGNVGTDFRDQFTALGPHVNPASRIESRSKGGQILISQSTEARVKDCFALNPEMELSDTKNIPGTFRIF